MEQPDISLFTVLSYQPGQGACCCNVSEPLLSSDITDVRNHASPGDALGDYTVH